MDAKTWLQLVLNPADDPSLCQLLRSEAALQTTELAQWLVVWKHCRLLDQRLKQLPKGGQGWLSQSNSS